MRKRVLRKGRYVFLTKCDRCGAWIEQPIKVRDLRGTWLEVCEKCKETIDLEMEKLLPPEMRTPHKPRPPRKRGPHLAPWERD